MRSLQEGVLFQIGILLILVAAGLVCAQETGGGSTENFKRPSNPSVYHRRQGTDAAAGGRTTEPAVTKPGNRNAQSAEAPVAGIEPGAAAPTAMGESSPPSPPKPRKNRMMIWWS